MKHSLFLLFVIISFNLFGQDENDVDKQYKNLGISALLGYNFNGKGDVSNLTPEVFLGWTEKFDVGKKLSVNFNVGPSVSSIKNNPDTSDYYRTIMLPGNASVSLITYLHWEPKNFGAALLIGGGIKILSSFKDSSSSIQQDNVKLGIGLQYKKNISIIAYYTWGWHNLTSESERTYKELFKQSSTSIQYFTISIQTLIPSFNLYLNMTWKSLMGNTVLPGLDNKKIITVGLRKDIDLVSAFRSKM